MAHVAEWKVRKVNELADMMLEYPIVGIASIEGIPAPQMQKMRRSLLNKAKIVVVKNRLLKLAIDKASEKKSNLEKLKEYIEGQTALILSKENPFRLYKLFEKSRTKAPAKGGEIAPEDIVVPAGDTPFRPGPIIAEFQKAGIPAAIEKGKIVIKKDTTVVKKGEKIPREVAQILTKLEIYPLTVGIELRAAYEDGVIFPKDVLQVDTEKIIGDLALAYQNAMNLSLNIAYPTKQNISLLLMNAHQKALNLAINAGVISKETLPILISKAYAQMISLASMLKDGLDDELKEIVSGAQAQLITPQEEKKEEKEEEKKEEKEEEKREEEAIAGLGALFG